MTYLTDWRLMMAPVAVVMAVSAAALGGGAASPRPAASMDSAAAARSPHASAKSLACVSGSLMCTEVSDYHAAFGNGTYVGHDSPSVLYYSNRGGSGNRDSWTITLPKDPPPTVVRGRSWTFELASAFWFGMALCDSQSYPQQVSTCTRDSNSNITPLAQHPGTAFGELQFFPPGWVKQFNGNSCSATAWCAAMNIDSLSEDPVNGTTLNPSCQAQVLGGIEYVNFAFLTHSGKPVGPPNPLHFNPLTSGNPSNPNVLLMRPGDTIRLTMHDTPRGITAVIHDRTSGRTGSMTTSAANGFAQIQAAPTGSTCAAIPYNFHPMYSTSTPQTRVPWAAHSYNIAMGEDIGHFDQCKNVDIETGTCLGQEGAPGDHEPADSDDFGCFRAADSLRVRVSGCDQDNLGFDGASYQRNWPNGNKVLHPQPTLFSSPLTGARYTVAYDQAGFEADTPRIEGACNRSTGVGCTLLPVTDDGISATFYPFFSITRLGRSGCRWFIGDVVPRLTARDFGGILQYGAQLAQPYLVFGGGGATVNVINDFRRVLASNPCPR